MTSALRDIIPSLMTPWMALMIAGVFEIGFTTCMKLSENFSKLPYTLGFFACGITSFYLLNRSLSAIPIGTAYAVWTGIGAFGTAVIGIIFFKDPASFARVFLLTLLVGSIVGLKLIPN